jgi:hypothetical protein
MDPLRRTLPEAAPPPARLSLCPPPHDVSPSTLDRFALGQASPEENRAVVRHLLAGCRKCQGRLRERWGIPGSPLPEGAYDRAFDRSRERCLPRLPALAER